MDLTFVDNSSIKSLEEYAVFLTMGMLTLMTLQNLQVTALKSGIMPEDLMERAAIIIHDLKRLMAMYQNQLESSLELIGGDFSAETIIHSLRQDELKKARSMIKLDKDTRKGLKDEI